MSRLRRAESRPLFRSRHVSQAQLTMIAERLALLAQYLLPKRLLTAWLGRLADRVGGASTTWLIRAFISHYKVDMSEAAEPNPGAYASFNAFFTRALRPGVRVQADSAWTCPVDGTVSEFGTVQHGQLLQAKGKQLSVEQLLAGDMDFAETLRGGRFATLYLAPRDYHRIHMPRDGTLVSMRHVPGSLFSVNPVSVRGIEGLFARNERVICRFADPAAKACDFAMVLVGATIVGSIETVWHGIVTPPRANATRIWSYPRHAKACSGVVTLRQGQEMGRFLLGSTVIVLMPSGHASLRSAPDLGLAAAPEAENACGVIGSSPTLPGSRSRSGTPPAGFVTGWQIGNRVKQGEAMAEDAPAWAGP